MNGNKWLGKKCKARIVSQKKVPLSGQWDWGDRSADYLLDVNLPLIVLLAIDVPVGTILFSF
jgi:hypothetical protein